MDSVSRLVTGWHALETMYTICKRAPTEGTEMTEQACKGPLPNASNNLCLMVRFFYHLSLCSSIGFSSLMQKEVFGAVIFSIKCK